ncbi:MAG TPA: DUF2332 domain-containing protein [Candidatus Eremiobacteraceae bacterium]|nr:DUF2332 domain-containing protein [Candidatus Eremiobacteraceae bacterium]
MNAATPEAEAFEQFARTARDSSPLYEHLARCVSTDWQLLALTDGVRPRHLQPNLLFAAVHYLLLKGDGPELARSYGSLGGRPPFEPDVFRHFRSFCLTHEGAIRRIVTARRVQTNEVRRCAALVPGFSCAAEALHASTASFVEIGASAGFNLQWDRYRCDYDDGLAWGNEFAVLQLACELRGGGRPSFAGLPKVAQRYGIDIAPLDARNADDVLWLRALTWPEHADRRRFLDLAVEVARFDPPKLIAGDAAEIFPSVVEGVAPDLPIIVYHSFTMNQLDTEQRELLEDAFCRLGARRPLARVGFEWAVGAPYPNLSLTNYTEVRIERCVLAECDPHCAWLRWVE